MGGRGDYAGGCAGHRAAGFQGGCRAAHGTRLRIFCLGLHEQRGGDGHSSLRRPLFPRAAGPAGGGAGGEAAFVSAASADAGGRPGIAIPRRAGVSSSDGGADWRAGVRHQLFGSAPAQLPPSLHGRLRYQLAAPGYEGTVRRRRYYSRGGHRGHGPVHTHAGGDLQRPAQANTSGLQRLGHSAFLSRGGGWSWETSPAVWNSFPKPFRKG